jgi:hypothetical protein
VPKRTVPEIVGYGSREEKGRLGDHPDPPSQLARGNVAVILSIQIHRSRSRLVQSIEEAKKGGLAGAARPDNRQNGASFNLNADVVNQRLPETTRLRFFVSRIPGSLDLVP